MSMIGQFVLAWALALLSMALGAFLGEGFVVLACVSGLLLISMAIRAFTNDRDWNRFIAAQGGQGLSGGPVSRITFTAIVGLIGAGWLVVGVLGLLAALGMFEFPQPEA